MKKLNNAVDALGEFLLKDAKNLDHSEYEKLEKIFFAIRNQTMITEEKIDTLQQENERLDEELEERKELIWNNDVLRKQIISEAFVAAHN